MKKIVFTKKKLRNFFYDKKFFTTKFFFTKKIFCTKNISLKVIPSILAQVGEQQRFSPKVPTYVRTCLTLAFHDFGLSLG